MTFRFSSLFSFSLLMAFLALTTACTPTEAIRGNIVDDYRMEELVPGVSTRTNVLKTLGSPTTQAPFDENVWYYIGQKTEKTGIFDPKVVDEKVVVVAFNTDGIMESINKVDANSQDIPTVRRKTPTSGNDITLMQQFMGNLGRFNKGDENATSASGINR